MLSGTEYAQSLGELLSFLSQTYVEVSGQTEALRTVVADLQSSLVSLHSRPSKDSEGSPTSVTPSSAGSQQEDTDACAPVHAHPHPTQAYDASAPSPALRRAATTHKAAAVQANSTSGARSTLGRASSAASRAGKPPVCTTAATAAAANRGVHRAASPAEPEVGVVSRACLESIRNPQANLSTPLPPPVASIPTPDQPASRTAAPPPHNPATPHPTPSSKTPSLSLSFKRALTKHQDTLRTACQAHTPRPPHPSTAVSQPAHLYHHEQLPHSTSSCTHPTMACPEDAALLGMIGSVSDAAHCFTDSLNSYYGHPQACSSPVHTTRSKSNGDHSGNSHHHSSSHSGSSESKQNIDFEKSRAHEADVAYVALVAAQTWLLQALGRFVQQGGKPGGAVPASDLLQLLDSLPQLQAQLSTLNTPQPQSTPIKHHASVTAHGSAPPTFSPHEAAAAAHWRNRFLRAAMDGPVTHGHIGVPLQPKQSAGSLLSKPAAGSEGSPRQWQGDHAACPPSLPPRPLGIWLPDVCFQPLLHAHQANHLSPVNTADSSTLVPEQSSPEWEALLQQAPWLIALPTASARAACSSTASGSNSSMATAGKGSRTLVPKQAHLAAHAPGAGVAHARSQVQLQVHLMHAWVESRLAARLLPEPSMLQQCVAALQQIERREGRSSEAFCAKQAELSRLLAAWRLAHTFLSKNAWNRGMHIAEAEAVS